MADRLRTVLLLLLVAAACKRPEAPPPPPAAPALPAVALQGNQLPVKDSIEAGPTASPPAPPPEPAWWKAQFPSEGAATAWWSALRAQQAKYLAGLPAGLAAALADKKEFLPFAPFNRGYGQGDYNCDGAADYAVVGLKRSSEVAKALAEAAEPTLAALGPLWHEIHRLEQDDAAEVQIALSGPGGFSLVSAAGSALRNFGPFPASGEIGCSAPEAGFDLAWARANRCDVLAISCCEKDGFYLAWDRRGKKLVSVGGC